MDVFITLAQAKLDLKGSSEECSWLQTLFQVVSDNFYSDNTSFSMSCEEICIQILTALMSENGNSLPINHAVLSVKDLCNDTDNVAFTGTIGNAPEIVESSLVIPDFDSLEERSIVLIGYLTANPKSKVSLFPGTGLVYLEDKKNAIICQVHKPRKEWLNNLVLLKKWNFIPCPKFPLLIFEGDTAETVSKFGYIEVLQDCVYIGNQRRESYQIPKSLSVGEYTEVLSTTGKFNLKGCLRALSPVHRFIQNNTKGKPFFLAQLVCSQTQYSTVIVFQGERFAHWCSFLNIGETYVISNLVETTMNKGQASERRILAATRASDFFRDEQHSCNSSPVEEVLPGNPAQLEEKKRKREGQKDESKSTEREKRLKERHLSTEQPSSSIANQCFKSGVIGCSAPMTYEGVITAVVDIEAGIYEVDNRMKLFTHFQPCTNFGCGMRVGATVSLHNVHLCKSDQKVLGICCCTYSAIRVTRYSNLSSPFKAFVPLMSYFYYISQRLPLLQFVQFQDLIEVLTKKFSPTLSRTDIIGPKRILRNSSPPRPTVLSHIVNLESLTSSSPRDIYTEFFDQPHSCQVVRPSRNLHISKVQTLLDVLNLIEHLGAQDSDLNGQTDKMREQYGWRYKEFTKEELPEDIILVGWLSCCSKTGQLFLCDETAKIPCVITGAEISDTIHKCVGSCLYERKSTKNAILGNEGSTNVECPLVQPSQLGAILKLRSFKIIIETFRGRGIFCNESDKVLMNGYLVYSLHQVDVIGMVPAGESLGISKNKRNQSGDGEETDDASERCFVFLLRCKELSALDLKDNNPNLVSYVHGYFLGEMKKSNDGDPNDIELEVYKKSVIILISKNSIPLAYLHPGCLYYVTERCHVGGTSRIQSALDLEAMCPVIELSSNLCFTQVDKTLLSQDIYKQWEKLTEECLRISSVRESLSRRNEGGVAGSGYQESLLFSFRGVIINRDVVLSNKADETCPFPTIPSGKMYLPQYGLISRTQAHALCLGYCFLSTWNLVLTVRDAKTADTVKIYLDLSTRGYPLGLVPGAMVTFTQVTNHVSKKGNIYFSFKGCSDLIIESIPLSATTFNEVTTVSDAPTSIIYRHLDSADTTVRHIIDFCDAQSHGKVIPTVAYIVCRITAVQRVQLKWTCSKCGKPTNNCYCFVAGGNQSLMFNCQARCLVEDGTCEAMLFVEDDKVKDLLSFSDKTWNEIKDLCRKQGGVWYQRSAYWKNSTTGSDSKAGTVLSNHVSSPHILRKIKVLCRQFRMNVQDDIGPEGGFETRTITVDRNEYCTFIFGKITLNVLEVRETNNVEESRRLLELLTPKVMKM